MSATRVVRWLGAYARGGMLVAVMTGASAVQAQTPAPAQPWPQRNVRFIIPFGPGAGADISARLVSDALQKKWGKPVVIENRPGGDALVAINAFKSAADDHVLLYGAAASFVAHPYLYDQLPYNQQDDLLPVARISITVMALGVPASLKIGTVRELVAHAKANPGKLNSASVQGMSEIVFYGFMRKEGIDMPKVPYRDIVQAPTDVAEGRVHALMASLATMQPLVQADKIKVLSVGGRRTPLLVDVPTSTEAGYPHLENQGLIGVFGPRGMPLDLRKRIAADIIAAGSTPEITSRLTGTAQLAAFGGPDELSASIDEMRASLDEAAKLLGMKRKN
jgi:tripartite-type tricarboxylate transporter receptor subunit TctC